MSDQGSHFINRTLRVLTNELEVQHKRSTPYHQQENGAVEAFNKILETTLTKVCNANWDGWNLKNSCSTMGLSHYLQTTNWSDKI